VQPRTRHSQKIRIVPPPEPGSYLLAVTMVQEHQLWFDRLPQPFGVEWPVKVLPREQMDAWTLSDLSSWTSAHLVRDGLVANLGFLSDPRDRMLTFVEAQKFVAAAIASDTACVLTTPELAGLFPERMAVATHSDPRRAFFEIHNQLAAETDFYGKDFPSQIDPSARLHPRSWVDESNVIIGPGVTVGPNASILGRATLGAEAVIQAGAVIGSSGFQTSHRHGAAIELAHAGVTEIGPNCHIFANAVIARGLFRQSTRVGMGCRVGNGAFISHNCVLGDQSFVGHGAVVNGNVKVGANAWIGPGATVVHNVSIGEGAQVSLGATVVRNVEPGKRVTGSLAMDHRKMLRLMAHAEKPESK
jgi:UDP-3-O-[3-hydroxymyristoyl] glucosamine N-acyltransferase